MNDFLSGFVALNNAFREIYFSPAIVDLRKLVRKTAGFYKSHCNKVKASRCFFRRKK